MEGVGSIGYGLVFNNDNTENKHAKTFIRFYDKPFESHAHNLVFHNNGFLITLGRETI